MGFRFEDFIAHVSTDERIRAGEYFSSEPLGAAAGWSWGKS
jgi:hypothetical protein